MSPGSPPNPQFDDDISTRLLSILPNLTTLLQDSTPVMESTRRNAKHGMVEDEDVQQSSSSRAAKKSRKRKIRKADVFVAALEDMTASNKKFHEEMINSARRARLSLTALAIEKLKKEYSEKLSMAEKLCAVKVFESEEKAAIFLALDGELQDKWLENRLESAKK